MRLTIVIAAVVLAATGCSDQPEVLEPAPVEGVSLEPSRKGGSDLLVRVRNPRASTEDLQCDVEAPGPLGSFTMITGPVAGDAFHRVSSRMPELDPDTPLDEVHVECFVAP